MKKTGLLLLSGFLVAVAIQIVPCSRGGSLHACCEKGVQTNIANPYTTCCEQERDQAITATLTQQNKAFDFQVATPVWMATVVSLKGHKIFTPCRLHWPNQSSVYLTNLNLLL